MRAVRLSQRLVLEAPARTPDGMGGFTEGWQALGTLWAELQPRSGREVQGEAGPVARGRFRITVRAAPEGSSSRPAPGQRFRRGSRIFDIQAVTERDAEGLYLQCEAQEEVAS
ncbi:head-tail adaptor protein [Alloyangia pacifica]|uniref:head-tail adaptor protein n=1 Tax=Alloyangia pacifica TaxID=311180 RepID=UPI001CD5E1A8|nr:head-tail adaptor protein [Alloyangia pacifica]MCA0994539.1 head-tail adaptor protein [Alloyangia pacifica]